MHRGMDRGPTNGVEGYAPIRASDMHLRRLILLERISSGVYVSHLCHPASRPSQEIRTNSGAAYRYQALVRQAGNSCPVN